MSFVSLINAELNAITAFNAELVSRDGQFVLGEVDVKAGGSLKFKTLQSVLQEDGSDVQEFIANGKSIIRVISGQFSLTSECANV